MTSRLPLLLVLSVGIPSLSLGAADTPAASQASAAALPSEAACAEFGELLADFLSGSDVKEVTRLFDTATFGRILSKSLGFEGDEDAAFRGEFGSRITPALQQQFSKISDAKFLRVQTVEGQRRVLVRCEMGDDGAAYLAFICRSTAAGGMVWFDSFNYISGEKFSETLRRTVLPVVAQARKGLLDKLTTKESAYVKHFPTFMKASRLVQQEKIPEAWAACETMPPEVQTDRTVLLLRLQIAQQIDDTKYLKVLDDWKTAFPSDPALDFLLIDALFLRKKHDEALIHLDAFAKRIGGDAYLDFLAATLLLDAGRLDDARKRARIAQAADADLPGVWSVLIGVAMKADDNNEVAVLLNQMRIRLPLVDLGFVETDEEYAAFRKSAAYGKWLEADKKAAAAAKKVEKP